MEQPQAETLPEQTEPDAKKRKGAKARKARAGKAQPAGAPVKVRKPVKRARLRLRHAMLFFSFFLIVAIPATGIGWYLWERAQPQFVSDVGFTVRREDTPTAVDVLGGLSSLGSSASSSDSDILFEFIQSQELVVQIDEALDLRTLYAEHYEQDPVFGLAPGASIEELVDYWQRMVQISYAPGTGLINLRAFAFDPEDAQTIAQSIFERSSDMINDLSDIARADSTRYATEDLEGAVVQLAEARQELTAFRSRTQIVDPSADIQLQLGVLNTLQQQLGEELINYDLLRQSTRTGDPRITQSEQKIGAIRDRIREEREKFGTGESSVAGEDYASLVAEFERLQVNLEYAEQKYTNALSNFDASQAEAQRQSRYLAAFVRPTIAETAEYPRKVLIFGLGIIFLLIAWATIVLIFYALRDRR
jgi:capsular polysaccharide transport system permease protein